MSWFKAQALKLYYMLVWKPLNGFQLRRQFGPFFKAAFGEQPLYFAFLHINDSNETARAIEHIWSATNKDASGKYIRSMFDERSGWRINLIAGVAVLKKPSTELISLLWRAIDEGCWASPQLAAMAYLVDPDFPNQAQLRLTTGCTVKPVHYENSVERHVTSGPDGLDQRAAKLSTTLIGLCNQTKDLSVTFREDALAEWKKDQFFEDWGKFAVDWLNALIDCIDGSIKPSFLEKENKNDK